MAPPKLSNMRSQPLLQTKREKKLACNMKEPTLRLQTFEVDAGVANFSTKMLFRRKTMTPANVALWRREDDVEKLMLLWEGVLKRTLQGMKMTTL